MSNMLGEATWRMSEQEWTNCTSPTYLLSMLGLGTETKRWRPWLLLNVAAARRVWDVLTGPACRHLIETVEYYAEAGHHSNDAWPALSEAWSKSQHGERREPYSSVIHWIYPRYRNTLRASVENNLHTLSHVADTSYVGTHCDLIRDIFNPYFKQPSLRERDRWLAWNGGAIGNMATHIYKDRPGPTCGGCAGTGRRTVTVSHHERSTRCVNCGKVTIQRSDIDHPYFWCPDCRTHTRTYEHVDCEICTGTGKRTALGNLDQNRLGILADALEDAGCSHEQLLEHLRGPGPHVRGCWALDYLTRKER